MAGCERVFKLLDSEPAWQRLDVDEPLRLALTENCTLMIADMCQILVNQEPT